MTRYLLKGRNWLDFGEERSSTLHVRPVMISAALSQGGSSSGERTCRAPLCERGGGGVWVDCVLPKSDATVFIKGVLNLHVLVLRFDTKRAVGLKSGLPVIVNCGAESLRYL
ncbi:hypothetical protein CDAR_589261 [Caerostris darwini]|uniref:Uncharacterized protein n=1 Tax=Caerostris darwini TaxID=1538125 RepID=A0AAV4TA76_9ARAC|nr:hypothetical protein CDAR_589261 [Caerostris darwini]